MISKGGSLWFRHPSKLPQVLGGSAASLFY
jgi:hypothetical protein